MQEQWLGLSQRVGQVRMRRMRLCRRHAARAFLKRRGMNLEFRRRVLFVIAIVTVLQAGRDSRFSESRKVEKGKRLRLDINGTTTEV